MTAPRVEAWIATAPPEASAADLAAIRATVLDYFEGWFDGDADRMAQALHPGLTKHAIAQDPARSDALELTTRDEMVAATGQGAGRRRDTADRGIRIEVVDVWGDMASVVVRSAVYIEYVLLARTAAGWRITSTLWQWAPGHGPRA